MKLIFVHGWSVTHTNTYRDLPATLAATASQQGVSLDIDHIHLGRYISFHDEVSMDDIGRAFNQALRELPGNEHGIQPFSCITHSTGGPVVRYWAAKYFGDQHLQGIPLQHLVMLAPANHGSSLAALGQKRVGRIKSWFAGIEPGHRVLDWLRLGSQGQFELNEKALTFKYGESSFFPFVIAGQGIDTKAYDFLNNYLVENGSDGVVRVCAANANCRFLSLNQIETRHGAGQRRPSQLVPAGNSDVAMTPSAPLAVMHNASHSGGKMGVLNAKEKQPVHTAVVQRILECLRVKTHAEYRQVQTGWEQFTESEQLLRPVGKKANISRYGMLVFRVKDSAGDVLNTDDYDVLLLAGRRYSPDELPTGFFVDRQINQSSQALVYYVDIDKMLSIKDGKFGVAVVARPEKGFSYYRRAEFHADENQLKSILAPNETTYVDITLQRYVDENVFRFEPAKKKQASFKNVKPSGNNIA